MFDVIEQQAEADARVAGIGPVRAKRIIAGWADQKVIREIMLFLHSHGVGTSRSVRIFKTYGADAIQLISENPYRLARDIQGIGFITADAIAARLGIEKTAMVRARAPASPMPWRAMDEGHCGLPRDELLALAEQLLEIPSLIEEAIALELADGTVIADRLDERKPFSSPASTARSRTSPCACSIWRQSALGQHRRGGRDPRGSKAVPA